MSFFQVMSDIANISITESQAEALKTELKNLDKFFNEEYQDSDEFSNSFFNKFESIANKYGFHEGTKEAFIETLYFQVDELKNLAANLTVIGRQVTQSEFADYAYQEMIMELQRESEFDE